MRTSIHDLIIDSNHLLQWSPIRSVLGHPRLRTLTKQSHSYLHICPRLWAHFRFRGASGVELLCSIFFRNGCGLMISQQMVDAVAHAGVLPSPFNCSSVQDPLFAEAANQ